MPKLRSDQKRKHASIEPTAADPLNTLAMAASASSTTNNLESISTPYCYLSSSSSSSPCSSSSSSLLLDLPPHRSTSPHPTTEAQCILGQW